MYRFTILLLTLIVVTASPIISQDARTLFTEGNRLYIQESYEDALSRYLEAYETGYINGELCYNIGNSYFKLNRMGSAILWYERARKYMPDDEDLLSNIDLANINIIDRITPVPDVFYVKYWKSFRNLMSPGKWKALFAGFWFLFALIVSLMFFSRNAVLNRILKVSLFAALFFVLLSGSALYSSVSSNRPGSSGVIMEQEVLVYAAPTETGTELFSIHEGTVLEIKRTLDNWIEIRLADGKVGWITVASIEVI